MKKRFYFTNALIFCTLSLIAQEPEPKAIPLTLEEAIEIALRQSLSLENSRLEEGKTRRELNTIWNLYLPTISASTRLSHTDRLFSIEPDPTPFSPANSPDPVNLNLGFSLNLNLNASSIAQIAAARYKHQSGEITLRQAERELTASVKKSFYGLLALEKNIEYLEANLKTAREQFQQTGISYRNGYVSEVELLQSEVAYVTLIPALEEERVNYLNQKALFLSLIGLEPESEFVLVGDLADEVTRVSAKAESQEGEEGAFDPRARDDWRLLRNNILALRESRTASFLARRSPTLSLGANWSSPINDPYEPDSYKEKVWNDSLTLSIGITVPLDSWIPGSSTDTELRGMNDDVAVLENQLSLMEEAAWNEVRNLRRQLITAEQNIEAQLLNVQLAERSYTASAEGQRQGTVSQIELENSRNRLLQARQGLLYQQVNYLNTSINLVEALGGER